LFKITLCIYIYKKKYVKNNEIVSVPYFEKKSEFRLYIYIMCVKKKNKIYIVSFFLVVMRLEKIDTWSIVIYSYTFAMCAREKAFPKAECIRRIQNTTTHMQCNFSVIKNLDYFGTSPPRVKIFSF